MMREKIAADNQYLWQLQQIILDYIANRPIQVFLYGSRARGAARKTSDVDVALLAQSKLPDGFIAKLREIIEESTVPYQVDIVDLNEVDDKFRQKVLQEAKSWSA